MEFTAQQIAEMTGGKVEGNPSTAVHTIAKIEEGIPGSITFLANPKYTHHIYDTKASIVLVKDDFVAEKPVSATLIRVNDPYTVVAHLLQAVAQLMEPQKVGIEQPSFIADGVEISSDCYVGAFAYIGNGCKIGKNVKIYPQAYVGDNCQIGDNSVIKPGVKIYHNCVIGKNVIIHGGAVIGADGFGFAPNNGHYDKIPQIGNVVILDNVEIGANTTIDRATMGSTVINEGVKLDNLIQIAHNCEVGSNTVIAAQTGVAGSTKIGCNNMIGGQVGFAGHITVGDNNAIGAQSGIPNNVGSGKRLMGYPAVDGAAFARQAVNIKNLSRLYAKVAEIEKELKE
ncbi:MAG: UDP-3-O-(3-hydroxymyristoyl)glucosamine N-acyltransferase [Muribaculaceae bacterium]|nr:UDP-3-O-(3-hydroxymyristoyl)glucosamine N-acyltransferase [Muribaculaceae bacterium]